MEGIPIKTVVEMEETYPVVSVLQRGLQVASDGSIWVLSGRGMKPEKPEVMAVYDVFDREGIFVRQVEMVAPHDASRSGIVLADDNRVIVIKGFLAFFAVGFQAFCFLHGQSSKIKI